MTISSPASMPDRPSTWSSPAPVITRSPATAITQALRPAARPLVMLSMAPRMSASGKPSTRSATGKSAAVAPRGMARGIGSPSSAPSSAMTGRATVALCCTRAASSDGGGSAPRYPGTVQKSSK